MVTRLTAGFQPGNQPRTTGSYTAFSHPDFIIVAARMMSSQNRRILVNFKTKKEPRKSKENVKENKTESEQSKCQLKFLTDVTSDILNRGIFSERGLRSAINSQVRH